jgi:serine/threonine-protein kinase
MANSPARAVVDVGSVIADTYTIEALLGRGGMGAVFLASHKRLPGKKVAIKMLHAEISDEETLARFKREAQIASLLGHPNIVHVEDFDVMPDGTPYLVLEYLQGETLAQRLRGGPLPTELIFSIVRQIGSALAAAHRAGVVHRDLKPQNIFLVPTELDGREFEQVKVLDFGISKMRGSQTVKTQETALLGTPQYMAPEQATGKHDSVDERTDIFALGAIVYEMVTGHPAFVGASIPEVVFKVVYEQPAPLTAPAAITNAVQTALSKSQDERFPTINRFVEALTGQPLVQPKATPTPSPDGKTPTPKFTDRDALAATMGSGDHAEAVGPVRGSAPTVSTGGGAAAATMPAPPVEPRKSRAPLVIAGALVVAALGGVGLWLATRGGGEAKRAPTVALPEPVEKAPPPPVEKHEPPPPPPVEKKEPPPPPVDKKEPPPPVDKKEPPAVAKQPPPPVDKKEPPPDEKDPVAKGHLGAVESAIAAKEWVRARELANKVVNSPDASDFQKSRAHSLLGVIACHSNTDQEGAQRELRQITIPRLRARLIAACREDGVTLSSPAH